VPPNRKLLRHDVQVASFGTALLFEFGQSLIGRAGLGRDDEGLP